LTIKETAISSVQGHADPQAPDRELVRRFLSAGDDTTFRQLYRAHTPALFLLALRLVGGFEPDAEDAVQETWVRAVRLLPGFRWDSALRTWLCGITVNCCREVVRKRLAVAGLDESSSSTKAGPRPEHIDLERTLRALPNGYREVLVLHDVEGMTHEEIGKLLEISVGTSKSQLFNARRVMRERLGRPHGKE